MSRFLYPRNRLIQLSALPRFLDLLTTGCFRGSIPCPHDAIMTSGNFRLQESELVLEKIAHTFIWIIRDIKKLMGLLMFIDVLFLMEHQPTNYIFTIDSIDTLW